MNQVTDSLYNSFNKQITVADNLGWQVITLNYTVPDNTWTAVSFLNSWTNFGGGNYSVSFLLDTSGFVHFRGTAAGGVIGANIFVLPSGLAPAFNINVPVVANAAFGYCVIFGTGGATPGGVQAALGSNIWYSLEGISYQANPLSTPPQPSQTSFFPYYAKSNLRTPVAGFIVSNAVDTTGNVNAAATITGGITATGSSTGDGRIKIDSISGLTPGRSYKLTILAIPS
jgi:hypothetical protein